MIKVISKFNLTDISLMSDGSLSPCGTCEYTYKKTHSDYMWGKYSYRVGD